MDKKFCITTLTHTATNRIDFLYYTIESFVQNTKFNSIDWFILINGYTDEWDVHIEKFINRYPTINFNFIKSNINLGVGAGINKLNSHVSNYEYIFLLEGDWMCVPENLTNINKEWLIDCLSYLDENKEIDNIQFRKYNHDIEHRQNMYANWIISDNIERIDKHGDIQLLRLKERQYNNNPTIRRNGRYEEIGIYPLPEFFDEVGIPTEIKGHRDWGQAEIQMEKLGKRLKSTYLLFGKFVHCDHWPWALNWDNAISCRFMCSKYNGNCKYGFLNPRKIFCYSCRSTTDFTDLMDHNSFFEKTIHFFDGDIEQITDRDNIEKLMELYKEYGYELNVNIFKEVSNR